MCLLDYFGFFTRVAEFDMMRGLLINTPESPAAMSKAAPQTQTELVNPCTLNPKPYQLGTAEKEFNKKSPHCHCLQEKPARSARCSRRLPKSFWTPAKAVSGMLVWIRARGLGFILGFL